MTSFGFPTIVNVISHYLANGKRVLVTSMKDPALAVLREQLPDDIRPLAISLLSTELNGMKQFEHAIHKIASEVQSIDRTATAWFTTLAKDAAEMACVSTARAICMLQQA